MWFGILPYVKGIDNIKVYLWNMNLAAFGPIHNEHIGISGVKEGLP